MGDNMRVKAVCVIMVSMLVSCGREADIQPRIPNPSFEKVHENMPENWLSIRYQGEADLTVEKHGRTGNSSVLVSSKTGADASWSTVLSVKPFARYILSGWIRTENVTPLSGRGALFNIHGIKGAETPALTGNHGWTPVEMDFETGWDDAIQVNCLLGGFGLAAGKAWFDDVALKLIAYKAMNPQVVIDPENTGGRISPYIYGQFIEHLGRCIYGGIWAEMLEDRKFYYDINDDYQPWGTSSDPFWKAGEFRHLVASPWKVMGPPGSVLMDEENPFVGAHTPMVQLPGDSSPAGIRQEGLALVKNRTYTGYVILKGDSETVPVEVRLAGSQGKAHVRTILNLGLGYQKLIFDFKAAFSDENASLEIVSRGKGRFHIGTVSLMPQDHIQGFRADVLALLRELNAPIYRWPGGNFVSGYNWRDGIGDRDRRPPRKNPAWTGVEPNDVGIHEYMDLLALIGAEPFISVNTGLGSARAAAEQVQYCTGSVDTPMGKLRASNGHPEPFYVKWWAVGNEMYGSWQLGHMPLEEYVKKHNRTAEAMRKADPKAGLVAVGSVGEWSEMMLTRCGNAMNLISEHIYCQEKTGLLGHTAQLADQIRLTAEAHRKYRKEIPGLAEKDIRIAMDEWNYWYGDYLYGELGVRYHLKDALGVARGLHEYFRNSDIFEMANYAQTVNVIGCIKTTRTSSAFETTGLVLKLYRSRFGSIPVGVAGMPEPLDVAAALTEDRKTLTIGVVNPTTDRITLTADLGKNGFTRKGTVSVISGEDPMAYNEPGKKPVILIREMPFKVKNNTLSIPPLSVTVWAFERQ